MLSFSQNIKFNDLSVLTPLDAFLKIPAGGLTQIFAAISFIELYELTTRNGFLVMGEPVAPGLQPSGLTGDLGWNPMNFEYTERTQLAERQNGRAAMLCICAWVAASEIPGSVPLPLPW
jgi:hypothetical protein